MNESLKTVVVPEKLKAAVAYLTYKKECKMKVSNYRPISIKK